MLTLVVCFPTLRVAMQFIGLNENTQIILAKLEALDECQLILREGFRYTKLQWLIHLIGELCFAHLV